MSAKELFEKAKQELDAFRQKEVELWEHRAEANRKANEAFITLIQEEKTLSQHPWFLRVDNGSGADLISTANSSEWKELSDFAETNYHCRFSLQDDDGDLRFDDGEVSIHINDLDQLSSMIDKYGLRVSLSPETISNRDRWTEKIAIINKWQELLYTKV